MRTVAARRFLIEPIGDLFNGDGPGGYLVAKVTAGGPVIGFQKILLEDRETVIGLAAASNPVETTFYSAQYVRLYGHPEEGLSAIIRGQAVQDAEHHLSHMG